MSSNNLSSSANFIWLTSSVLGKGATGNVFQGISKKNGEAVAIKSFNNTSRLRPDQVQIREFDLLRRVDHENIVKLLAVEDETKTQNRVLVMEYCNGSSLFNILDDPENTYGVGEDEFLLVLKHTSNGMKHLCDNNIVHRDLKPGNIVKLITDDGRSIYKLTDFGAARELHDDQQFLSLYGTEEYLHPDLYERAVLKKDVRKGFGATVDLWSIGVTLYHVATGLLPFRPHGGRKNCETMYKITTQKVSGIISGVQSVVKGPIEWSDQLPSTCQLSGGLKKIITPILAGLMETNATLMWSFDHFFTEVTNLNLKRKMHVFYVDECQLLILYVDPNANLSGLASLIQEQTSVPPDQQRMFFDHKSLDEIVNSQTLISNYPQTSSEKQIFVVGSNHPVINYTEQVPYNFPNFTNNGYSVDQEAITLKLFCSNGYFVKRSIEKTGLIFSLMKDFAQTMNAVVIEQFKKLVATIIQADAKSAFATQKIKMLQNRHRTTVGLLDLLEKSAIATEERNKLNLLVNSKQESSTTVIKQLSIVRAQLMSTYQRVVTREELWNQWKEMPSFKKDLSKCPAFADSYARILRSCWQNIEKNRKQRSAQYLYNEPLNVLERLRTLDNKQKLCHIYQEQCLPVLQEAVGDLGQWLNMVRRTLNNDGNDEDLQRIVDMISVHDSTLDKTNETYDEIIQELVRKLNNQTSKVCSSSDGISEAASVRSVKTTKSMIEKLRQINEANNETLGLMEMNQTMINKFQEASLGIKDIFDKYKT